jgi:hypothetical protein
MKKILILGALLLSSCSSYRIEVIHSSSGTFYTPSKRHGLYWNAYYYIFPNKLGDINQSSHTLLWVPMYGWNTKAELRKSIKSPYLYFK